jgi:hypothetical protein
MTAMCVSDQVLALLRNENAKNVMRLFQGEGTDELNYLLARIDTVEDAVQEALAEIKRIKFFDMIPFLGRRLREIRSSLEQRVSAQRGRLPV